MAHDSHTWLDGRQVNQPPQFISADDMYGGMCPEAMFHVVDVRIMVARNGTRQAWVRCTRCEARTGKLKHSVIRELFDVDVNTAPVNEHCNACWKCAGAGCETCCPVPCARCKQHVHTQHHHTAPRALFPDADCWPIVALCQPCHTAWHTVMTPGMRYAPHPVAPHLSDEWDTYQAARAARETHQWSCECDACMDARTTIAAFGRKHHVWIMP